MSYRFSIDTSPSFPIYHDENSNPGQDGFHTTAASPNALSGVQQSNTPTSNTDIHHEDNTYNTSTASPLSLNRNRRRPSSAEGQEGVAPVASAPDGFNEGTNEVFGGPSSLAGYTSDDLRRLAEAPQPPVPPIVSVVNNPSASGNARAVSPAGWLKKECEELRKRQELLQINIDGPSRTPVRADFPPALSMTIISPVKPAENCIIMMHDLANNEASLESHAQVLRSKQPESAFILLRGLLPIEPGNSGYHWADANGTVDEGFMNTSRVILKDLIQDGLMAKCSFHPRDIVILGLGQGGMAALAATASWNCVEFGGVVSFGGPMPGYVQLPFDVKAKSPALIYGGARGDVTPTALQQIQENFSFTDHHISPTGHDIVPLSDQEIKPLLEFFAHRLRREEWKRQAVISFDGGGIRGYGSLLILQDLMNKVGDLEKRLDEATESSFSPCDYKPTMVKSANVGGGSANSLPSDPSEPSDADAVGPTRSHRLPNSALFLPCHYFTCAAGTSTGGLISIMLSRFRMTVDDCIEEYKALGEKIFGHPRRMAKGGFPWHRFNARVLEDVIRAVISRHNIQSEDFESRYGMDRMDEDMSQCIVLAYSDILGNKGEVPYLFRTYGYQAPPRDPSRSRMRQPTFRNPGGASMLTIWEIARATSAAPGYFPPIRIKTGHGSEVITFKDGGFGSNNPSEEAYQDILDKHGGSMHMGPFISIGTGITPLDMFGKRSDNLSTFIANIKTTIKLPSRTLRAHGNMVRHANRDNEERFPYFRFDGGHDLGEVDLGEWETHRLTRVTGKDKSSGRKTLKKIETAVAVYLHDREVQKDLMECAKLLVNRRRLRARDASNWDRYASYSHYECDLKGCQKRLVNTAHDFKEHLRRDHKFRLVDPVIDKKILECRRVRWLYRSNDTTL